VAWKQVETTHRHATTLTPPPPPPHHHCHRQASSAAVNATAAIAMVSFFSSLPVVAGGKERGQEGKERQGHTVAAAAPIANQVLRLAANLGTSDSLLPCEALLPVVTLPPPPHVPPSSSPRRRPPPVVAATVPVPVAHHRIEVGFQMVSPKKIPFEDTTDEAVVVLAVEDDGPEGGKVECAGGSGMDWGGRWCRGQGLVGDPRSMLPYFDIFFCCSHIFVTSYFFCKRNQVTIQEAYVTGQKVMGRSGRKLGELLSGSPEDLRFRAFFGVSAQVAVTAWSMMEDHSVLPPNPKFIHFLWALAFMRTYPANDTTLSCLLGGSDPKTISKYVWPLIESLFELNETVVSICLIVAFVDSLTFH
jgi:hypothetical protein